MTDNETCTGLSDSNGRLIKIGNKVKHPVDCNQDLHGEWAVYKIKQRGIVPVLSYEYSEKGRILPEGYTGSPLSDHYDSKMFMFANDVSDLTPNVELLVLNEDDPEYVLGLNLEEY